MASNATTSWRLPANGTTHCARLGGGGGLGVVLVVHLVRVKYTSEKARVSGLSAVNYRPKSSIVSATAAGRSTATNTSSIEVV